MDHHAPCMLRTSRSKQPAGWRIRDARIDAERGNSRTQPRLLRFPELLRDGQEGQGSIGPSGTPCYHHMALCGLPQCSIVGTMAIRWTATSILITLHGLSRETSTGPTTITALRGLTYWVYIGPLLVFCPLPSQISPMESADFESSRC